MSAALGPQDATRLQECLTGGGVAVFPSDTVYGICCDPEDEHAAARLYELKGRPASRPAAVMFFTLEPALAALPSSASANGPPSMRCSRVHSRCCWPTPAGASARPADRSPRPSGCASPDCPSRSLRSRA